MQLSNLEYKAYNAMKSDNFQVFTLKDLCLVLTIPKTKAYNLIKALKKKKAIKKTSGSSFAFFDTDEYVVAVNAHYPSYISFWTALNYYGWSDQTPKEIYLCTTRYTKQRDNFHYITISKKRFFGYTKLGDIIIAEKEKAIIDSLLLPKYAGGIEEIEKCIAAGFKQLDPDKLITYALKIQNKAVLRRLGFIMEKLKYMKKFLPLLQKHIGNGYERLDPTLPRKNNFNKKWLLEVNI